MLIRCSSFPVAMLRQELRLSRSCAFSAVSHRQQSCFSRSYASPRVMPSQELCFSGVVPFQERCLANPHTFPWVMPFQELVFAKSYAFAVVMLHHLSVRGLEFAWYIRQRSCVPTLLFDIVIGFWSLAPFSFIQSSLCVIRHYVFLVLLWNPPLWHRFPYYNHCFQMSGGGLKTFSARRLGWEV